VLVDITEWSNQSLFEALVGLSTSLEIKKQALLWVTRIAITGKESTAGGATEVADILGKEETLRRIDFSMGLLG
jgi:glutamyl-tRNA synthetase